MSTKHVERAVCAIKTHEWTPRKIRYSDTSATVNDHGHVTVRDESQMVEMTIHMASLMDWMGRRAMSTKSGRSALQDGMIVARVVGPRTVAVVDERDIPLPPGAFLVD